MCVSAFHLPFENESPSGWKKFIFGVAWQGERLNLFSLWSKKRLLIRFQSRAFWTEVHTCLDSSPRRPELEFRAFWTESDWGVLWAQKRRWWKLYPLIISHSYCSPATATPKINFFHLKSRLKSALYPKLRQTIEGKSRVEAADILLRFVQTAFDYQTDDVLISW